MASTRLGYIAVRREDFKAVAKKPTKFLRFKEGDIMANPEIIKNNPIQNNRRSSINALPGKIETAGSYKVDCDFNDIVHWMMPAFGKDASVDISSATDGSVWRHTIDHACKTKTLTIEQGKGELCDDPLTSDMQNMVVDRGFGCMIDSIKLSGSDSILDGEVEIKAHGVFQRGKLISNESPELASTVITLATWLAKVATFTSTAHGLQTGDLVTISGVLPIGYNGNFTVTSTTVNTFTVAIATDPTAYVSGGSVVKLATLFFDTTEGVLAGDLMKLYEKNTGTFENITVVMVDNNQNALGFSSITSTLFTVANESKITLIPQTPSYEVPVMATFTHVRYRFGTDIANAYLSTPENIEDRELEYKNNLEERYGSLRSSPSVIGEKSNSAMLKFSKYFESVEDRDRYLDQTKRACVMEITNNEIISATDTNQSKYSIIREFSDIRFTMYEMPTGTDELYAISAEAEAFFDTTDGRALRVIVQNKKPGTFYSA